MFLPRERQIGLPETAGAFYHNAPGLRNAPMEKALDLRARARK
jgi:hypothetical protein